MNTKLVAANALIFTTIERASESDSFVMIKIWEKESSGQSINQIISAQ